MSSDRSTVTTVSPDACSSFSLKRMVWNGPVRAPMAPMRACRKPAHRPADAPEALEVGREFRAVDVHRVAGRVGEGDAVLVEVVGDRDLSAEGVAAAVDVDLVDLVVAGLDEHRHAEFAHA